MTHKLTTFILAQHKKAKDAKKADEKKAGKKDRDKKDKSAAKVGNKKKKKCGPLNDCGCRLQYLRVSMLLLFLWLIFEHSLVFDGTFVSMV